MYIERYQKIEKRNNYKQRERNPRKVLKIATTLPSAVAKKKFFLRNQNYEKFSTFCVCPGSEASKDVANLT